jgi:hypothetical protein
MYAKEWQCEGSLEPSTLSNPALIITCIPPYADLSLEAFRHRLDEEGMKIAENQEQSVKSRKKLAEITRGLCFTASSSFLRLTCLRPFTTLRVRYAVGVESWHMSYLGRQDMHNAKSRKKLQRSSGRHHQSCSKKLAL